MSDRFRTSSSWLREHPPARFTETLAGIGRRSGQGEDFRFAVREFLDEFALRPDPASRAEAIVARPAETGERRHDAFLGALAEHLAAVEGIERPTWSIEPGRFLETFWFPSEVPGFRAAAIAQAPAAFRRRGISLPERSLHRV